ncbi:MAG: hypothetical protein ABSD78_03185 [Acidimicrobiales bacterium]
MDRGPVPLIEDLVLIDGKRTLVSPTLVPVVQTVAAESNGAGVSSPR